MPTRSPSKRKPSLTPRRRRGVKLRPTELGATQLALDPPPPELAALIEGVRADGGAVLAAYREPLGGHVRRLTQAMDKTKRFLDPIIAVREQTESAAYWTPNGYHRLTALKELGAKT